MSDGVPMNIKRLRVAHPNLEETHSSDLENRVQGGQEIPTIGSALYALESEMRSSCVTECGQVMQFVIFRARHVIETCQMAIGTTLD